MHYTQSSAQDIALCFNTNYLKQNYTLCTVWHVYVPCDRLSEHAGVCPGLYCSSLASNLIHSFKVVKCSI